VSKRAYSIVVALFLCFGIVFQRETKPFGKDFVTIFVPSLLFLNSLQWFILPTRVVWKVVGFCSSLTILSFLYFSYMGSQGKGLTDFATFLLLFIVAQSLAFWVLTRDNPTRQISVATNLWTLFLVLFGVFLNARGIETLGFSGGRFLLVSGLGVMALSVNGAAYGWRYVTKIAFICTLISFGISLFDVGDASNIRWISGCSAFMVFTGLGFAAYWAKDWNK
jgi:hypothetical protein